MLSPGSEKLTQLMNVENLCRFHHFHVIITLTAWLSIALWYNMLPWCLVVTWWNRSSYCGSDSYLRQGCILFQFFQVIICADLTMSITPSCGWCAPHALWVSISMTKIIQCVKLTWILPSLPWLAQSQSNLVVVVVLLLWHGSQGLGLEPNMDLIFYKDLSGPILNFVRTITTVRNTKKKRAEFLMPHIKHSVCPAYLLLSFRPHSWYAMSFSQQSWNKYFSSIFAVSSGSCTVQICNQMADPEGIP